MKCERCGAGIVGYGLHDYCASCSKNLCAACMAKGCCGAVPAASGSEADEVDESLDLEDRLERALAEADDADMSGSNRSGR